MCERMSSAWIDVQIKSVAQADELLGLLDDPDVQGAWQDDAGIHVYWPSDRWSSRHLARLQRILRQISGNGSLPEVLVASLPHQDWNRQWAESVKPLRIGRRIVIRPSWERVPIDPGMVEIVLDPKQAFGTGHHPTTRLLLEWMEQLAVGGQSVFDVGTGSGILAMVALRLGAARAVAIDNDPVAIECATSYGRENGFGDELDFGCRTLSGDCTYDLVLANLDLRTLAQSAGDLAGSTGHRLLVSGLLADQRAEIIDVFSRTGLYFSQQRELDDWLAIEFLQGQSCEGPA